MEKGVTYLLPVPKFLLSLPSILLSSFLLLHIFVSVTHTHAHIHTHTHTHMTYLKVQADLFPRSLRCLRGRRKRVGKAWCDLMIRSQRPLSGARLLSGVTSFGYCKGTCWHLPHSLLHRDSGTCLHRRGAGEDVPKSFLSWTSWSGMWPQRYHHMLMPML